MNVFDMIGPVMIGPSSSHTAGACRIGLVARHILDDAPVRARITLCGSFAQTYRGHGTDRALIAGLLGLAGLSLYPNLVYSNPAPEFSLTIVNAASSPRTLKIMLIIALIGMPLVLAYTIAVYRIFKGKVEPDAGPY